MAWLYPLTIQNGNETTVFNDHFPYVIWILERIALEYRYSRSYGWIMTLNLSPVLAGWAKELQNA
jgi:hypothetical protein